MSATSRPRRRIAHAPAIDGVSWWRGAPITAPVPVPLPFALHPYRPFSGDEAPHLGAILETNPPLWRDDLVQALRDCGVHNFETYAVAIHNPDNRGVIDDLHRELREAGVGDVERYLREIGHTDLDEWIDPAPGAIFSHYKAVNILGLVSAVDLGEGAVSEAVDLASAGGPPDPVTTDARTPDGLKLFRLVESPNAILVHASLRDALLARGFGSDVAFHDLKEAAL
ncbi:hypothetical protein FZO89_12530 [Luteimonas viscosa]|uniref:Uncharacterized protein n=1 Tax=Luteimonas viscosa TaxID=1132694 RepID=A0A5D4XQP6_9GAMM|nr:hypothetical protein [Luteimonas viscosa]TYT27018.1 hypothetical protein FZO89_12530 [Luteimonas viscosa]